MKIKIQQSILASLFFLFSWASFSQSNPQGRVDTQPKPLVQFPGLVKPKWDVGLAFGGFYLPDYPGADQSRMRTLVLPYVLYRGELIRNDRGGLRSRFINTERLEFSFSFSGSFPTRSQDNDARIGMSDLDWLGQLGPQLIVHLNKSPIAQIDLLIPYRFVFSTDLSSGASRGSTFNPEFRLRHQAFFDPKSFFSVHAGPTWGSESINDYFYEVPNNYATATRPTYYAKAGFMGWGATASLSREINEGVLLYMGLAKNYYAQAKNRSSPLLRDIENESFFVGFAWSLYQTGEEYRDPVSEMGGV